MGGSFTAWVAQWDRREAPAVLAMVRVLVGATLLCDFLTVGRLGLVTPLMAGPAAGGMSGATETTSMWFAWFGSDEGSAALLHASLVATSLSLMLGLSSRLSAGLLMLLSAQWALILPDGDRAIDMFLRNVLMVLAFSRAGATASIDAWFRTGTWWGSGDVVPAWPRYLLVIQIVAMYFTAGIQKYGQHWWPWGGWSGLYVILQDWAVAAYPFAWLARPPFYQLTQLATAITMVWQWTYPIVLVHYFPPRGPRGRFRTNFARLKLHWAWITIGALFHVGIGLTMELGIFPWGMMAVYPCFLHPDELAAIGARVTRLGRSPRTSGG